MLLNHTAEYAFRAMAILAGNYDSGERVRAKELAELAAIPEHYISKVMRHLVVAGLVEALRGHGGGFRLARAPECITFMDVLDASDWSSEDRRCAFGFGACNPKSPCSLHNAWSQLHGCVNQWAKKTTLAEVRSLEHLHAELASQAAPKD